jgi:hypothetical protein
VTVGVRVELHMQAVLFKDPPAEFVQTGGQLFPLLSSEFSALHCLPGLVMSPDIGNHDDVLAANGLGEGCDVGHLRPHRIPGIWTVQVLEYGSCQHSQPVLIELLRQLHRIRRQIAIRAELDPLIACLSDLTKKHLRGHLLGIAREPDAPRVRGGTDRDRG